MLTDSSGYTDFVNSVDSTTSMSSTQARLGAEDINGTQFSVGKSGSLSFEFYIFTQEQAAAKAGIEINGDNVKPITDYIYYDAINDSLWLGAYSSSGFYFINEANKINSDTNYSTPCTLSGLSIYPNAQYTAFAASGTELYIAYTNGGTSYLQRAKIEGENNSFTITAIGNPQSTQDMGVDGQITDIVIHYDGYVYVLVSQTGSKNFTDMYMVNDLNKGSEETTVYSRGAIVRLEPTSSGFKLSAKTGWTEDSRTIASSNKDKNNFTGSDSDNYTFYDVNAYIPEYSERNSHFYGPRRFVAIKPKELAIADCGANIVMPDYESEKNGKLFKHNRIVKVDLYKFALESSSVIDLNSINFSNLSLNGSIESVTDFKGLEDNEEK
ncbi:hypothetical protein [uncultured Treponema sp.]|uniref:hypothetical protein n=1 Tax=uncultured Treponema sp. TaxID=162155 RepID=UPI00280A9269|nr:hypothetical protein [uncultured Treponema sp.]